jgi:hypothetical protein
MRLFHRLKQLIGNERGNTLFVAAAAMPLVVGAAAIGVDTINVTLSSRQLQRAADSAALAGAHAVLQNFPASPSATSDLALNNHITLSTAPVIENAPTAGPYANNMRAVRVILTAQRSVPFMSFFGRSQMTITSEATAAVLFEGQFCVIALETQNVTGITFSGNTTANLGCGVMSNSTGTTAVYANGSAQVTASPISAVGRVPASGAYVGPTTLLPYAAAQTDPYASLPTPIVPNGCSALNVQPNQTRTVSPGCYAGMDIKGTVTFEPGTCVTFILTSRTAATNPSSIADINMNGNSVLDLTAPDSGTYKGVLIYQDRRAVYGSSMINGNSASHYQGAFYFPNRELTFSGNSGMRTECLQFVARRLVFTGNSRIQNTCPANSGSQAYDATTVRLVG